MANIFIIHGTLGHPKENWFPWLKTELEKRGHSVFIPAFPTPQNQSLESWSKAFEPYLKELKQDSILIGHSMGTPFLLKLLEDYKAKSLYSVAGFCSSPGNQLDESMLSFTQYPFNWQKILSNCKNFYIFHSNNDPYVPLNKAQELANNLHSQVNIISDAGHFNSAAGYTQFPFLLEEINKDLEQAI